MARYRTRMVKNRLMMDPSTSSWLEILVGTAARMNQNGRCGILRKGLLIGLSLLVYGEAGARRCILIGLVNRLDGEPSASRVA